MNAPRATPAAIQALLHAFDARAELWSVERPGEGLANEVHFLATSRSDLVLKVFDHEAGSWKPQKERAVQAAMRAVGVPAAETHLVDTSRTVVPFGYSLTQRIAGDALSRVLPMLSVDEASGLYRQLGDCLGRLHRTTFDCFGDVSGNDRKLVVGRARDLDRAADGNPQGPFASWRAMHRAIVATRLNLMRESEFADLVPRTDAYFRAQDDLLAIEVVPRLLHMDLHPGNILVREGRIAGILDVEEAIAGHNEYDLMRTELGSFRGWPPAYERAFMDAYAGHIALDEGHEERKQFYDASRTLAWIQSLLVNDDAFSRDQAAASRRAARAHLERLVANPDRRLTLPQGEAIR